MVEDDERFMRLALIEAEKAAGEGETPIGAVAVLNGKVIAKARNKREIWNDPTAHAEIIALKKAAKKLNRWRLSDITLYVTLEPCAMCAGAMVLARIDRLVFGCTDPKAGSCGTLYNILQDKRLNHQAEIKTGVLEKECGALLKKFFKGLRNKRSL
ncbi:MAG: tRNA-specific adenosine deaminase [Nitrospirae bacterium RBG_19FT_COMBO_42_15]|nr:MAG: tRNA-specific adenosine deaminase [Nitrospirae bacterium RBG_19FT_COMBO_42_15]